VTCRLQGGGALAEREAGLPFAFIFPAEVGGFLLLFATATVSRHSF
jgi:hypothetical protein